MTMDQNKPLLSQPNWLLWIPLLISAVVLGAYVWNFVQQPLSDNAGTWGTFGDYFGGLLNPVIAACTLFVAMRVWELQKTELKATQKTLEQQRGEQRFFDLLNLYLSSVNSLRYSITQFDDPRTSTSVVQGKHAIQSWLIYAIEYEGRLDSTWNSVGVEFKERTAEFDMLFSAYFRTVTLIFENLEELTGEQHPTFARMHRAQLSHAELTLIGLCLLFHEDAKRSIPAFEKYGILKHLPDSRLRDEIAAKYPRTIDGRISMNQDVPEQEPTC